MTTEDTADDAYFLPELVEIKEEYYYDIEAEESSEEEKNVKQTQSKDDASDVDDTQPDTSVITEEMLTTHLQDIPSCWTERQCTNFKRTNRWLLVKNGKLGCKSCMMIRNWHKFEKSEKGLRPPTQGWRNCGINFCGKTIDTKRSSLRRKIFEHRNSKAHIHAVMLEQSVGRVQTDARLAEFKQQIDYETLSQMFQIVYAIAKQKRSYDDFTQLCSSPHLKDLVGQNFPDAGELFASLLDYIASQFRNFIGDQLAARNTNISIVIHESGMVAQKITLAVHFKLKNVGSLFFDLIGHRSPSSEEVVISLLNCLRKNDISQDYLKDHLVEFLLQPRSTLVGAQSKFGDTLRQFFPKAKIVYSVSRKSELQIAALHNAIRSVNLKDLFTMPVLANTMFLSAVGPNQQPFDVADFPLKWLNDERPVLTHYILTAKISSTRVKKISNDIALAAEANDDQRLVIDLKPESNTQETGDDDVVVHVVDVASEKDTSPVQDPLFVAASSIVVEPDIDVNVKRRKRSWRQAAADNKPNDLDEDVIEKIVRRVRDASDLYAINEDKDRLFLLSLLPFMKQLNAAQNLEFRTEIQQLVREKISTGSRGGHTSSK